MAAIYTVSQLNNEITDLLDAVPGYRSLLVQAGLDPIRTSLTGHLHASARSAAVMENPIATSTT